MPAKRARPRAAQPQIVQSDYDTDTANIAEAPSAQTHASARTNEELNLAVLQRHNPDVLQILSIAPFAVVYLFSPDTQQWEKSGVEGTLFVSQLIPDDSFGSWSPIERYNVTVLNRKGLDNFSTELLDAKDVEITEQFVILQVTGEDGAPQIIGLWIFSEPPPSSTAQTREINAQIIQECASRAEISRQRAEGASHGHDVVKEAEEQAHAQYEQPVASAIGRPHEVANLNELLRAQQHAYPQSLQQQHRPHLLESDPASHIQYSQQPQSMPSQPDVLLSLFRGAGQGPNR